MKKPFASTEGPVHLKADSHYINHSVVTLDEDDDNNKDVF